MVWKMLLTTLILHLISSGVGQNLGPDALMESSFPPARPSVNNLYPLCLLGNGRPRYSAGSFPPSSYAYAHRAGKAINRLEAWFSQCCFGGLAQGNVQVLCCAEQAWQTALSQYCNEEFSTMTLAHECCQMKGEDRWTCFENRAPNPLYQTQPGYKAPIIPPDSIFTWDPNTC